MCNKFGYIKYVIEAIRLISILMLTFVCVTLISVKSKYGSCNGNCTGLIIYKQISKKIKISINTRVIRDSTLFTLIFIIGKIPFVGITG